MLAGALIGGFIGLVTCVPMLVKALVNKLRGNTDESPEYKEFREMKDFMMVWTWKTLSIHRAQFHFTVIPNRGYTQDDQATLIGMAVNYLYGEPLADEVSSSDPETSDYVRNHRGLEKDAAHVVMQDSKIIQKAVLNVLLRQYYLRTKQYGLDYEQSEEGSRIVEVLKAYAPAHATHLSADKFRDYVNGIAAIEEKLQQHASVNT